MTNVCVWEENEDGQWHACENNAFEFTEGGPVANGFKFCPYCSRELKERKYTDPLECRAWDEPGQSCEHSATHVVRVANSVYDLPVCARHVKLFEADPECTIKPIELSELWPVKN